MFGVGLHFHLEELLAVRRIAIPGAIRQSGSPPPSVRSPRKFGGVAGSHRLRHGDVGGQHRGSRASAVGPPAAPHRADTSPSAGSSSGHADGLVLVLLPRSATSSPRRLLATVGVALLKLAGLVAVAARRPARDPLILDRSRHPFARALHAHGARPRDRPRRRRRCVRRLDGARRVPRRHGRRHRRYSLRPPPKRCHARCVRGAVLRLGRHAAAAVRAPRSAGVHHHRAGHRARLQSAYRGGRCLAAPLFHSHGRDSGRVTRRRSASSRSSSSSSAAIWRSSARGA